MCLGNKYYVMELCNSAKRLLQNYIPLDKFARYVYNDIEIKRSIIMLCK